MTAPQSSESRQPSSAAGVRHLRRRQSRTVLCWFFTFTFVSLMLWLYQQVDFAGSLELGIPIPDIVNISQTFDNLFSTGGLDQEANQFVGVSILYGWTWLFHPALCFLVNLALIVWATKLYSDYFINKLSMPAWSIFGVFGNPYIALAMVGPNKEIPLLLLTLLYFRVLAERRPGWLLKAVAICTAAFAFRDGHGAFLVSALLLLIVLKFRSRRLAIAICLGCVAVSTLFGLLESVIPILGRNRVGFEVLDGGALAVGSFASLLNLDPFTVFGGFLLFFLRALYNLLTLSLFPVIQTTGGINWLGLAYWFFGLTILVCLPCCASVLLAVKQVRSSLLLAAALTVGTWFMISVSLFVQPRYMMPALPLAFAAVACTSPRVRARSLNAALLITGGIIFAYWLLDRAPPIGEPDSFDTPAYIL
jgi:hypothetical protein